MTRRTTWGFLRGMAQLLAPVAVAFAAAGAEETSGDAGCAETVARRVQDHYEGVRDLTARFEQTTQSVSLGTGSPPLEASGTVTFAKPGRMRWSYTEPDPSLVVTDGRTLWLYDEVAREAQRMSVSGQFLSGAAIQFLLGEGDVLREFEVRAESCGEEAVRLALRPREPATYEKLEIVADPRTGEVAETTVVDLFGNTTRVRFREVRINQEPDAELFVFERPEGVRLLEVPGADDATQ